MRRSLVAGNAKMNLDRTRLTALLAAVAGDLARTPPACDVAYCPPFPLLPAARSAVEGTGILLGAQNLHEGASGAFTGEVSAAMLVEAGCRLVIVGHSERRTLFGETDARVRAKAAAALEAGLVPIVCVGETGAERERGETEVVLSRQMRGSLEGLPVRDGGALVVAYEPVWAIGTGKTATPAEAQDAHAHLRRQAAAVLGGPVAEALRILYGGSVKPDNAADLLGRPDLDGALVGGASLDAGSFLGILRAVPASRAG